MNPYKEALDALAVAENHLNNADPEFLDAAIAEMSAGVQKVQAVSRSLHKERAVKAL